MIDSVIIPLINRIENKKTKINILKRREIKRLFNRNSDKIKNFYLEEIKKHVHNAEELGKDDTITESSYKQLLTEAPAYIINKMLKEINISI
jgi:flagellar biosynthesis protein FliP